MGILYKGMILLILLLYPFVTSATCQIKPFDLQFYLTTLTPQQNLPYTTVILDTKKAIIQRPRFNDVTVNNISFVIQKDVVDNQPVSVNDYSVVIIPPTASPKAVRFDLPKKPLPVLTTFEERIRQPLSAAYTPAALGDKGALVLFKRTDITSCKSMPAALYILPESAKGIDNEVSERALYIADKSFSLILLAIMQANGDYEIEEKSLSEQLSHDVNNSNSTIRGRMLRSTVIAKFSDALRKQASTILAKAQKDKILALPIWSEWSDEIERIVQPSTIIRLRDFTPELSVAHFNHSNLKMKIRNNTSTDDDLEAFIKESEKVLTTGSAMYVDAEKYVNDLRAQNVNRSEADINAAQDVAVLYRHLIGFKSSLEQMRKQYENIYALYHKLPQVQIAGGFDADSILAADLNLPGESCNLPALEIKGPNITTVVSGKTLNVNSRFFVFYRKFRDPVYKLDLIRPHFLLAGNVSQVHSIHQAILNEKIPPSSCRHRYSQPSAARTQAKNGWIEGQSQVRYEKWICEDFDFICWDWGPKTCRKHIKTRVYGGNQLNKFTVSSSIWDQTQLKILLRSTFENSDSYMPFGNSDGLSFLRTTAGLKWESSRFDHSINNPNELLLLVRAKGKAMRINTACGLHEDLKKYTF